jgi:membrane protease YdiL (CAAX protease family)
LEFAMAMLALLWAYTASLIAARAAEGIALRIAIGPFARTLEAAFFVFLLAVGLRALDAVALRGRHRTEILPLPTRKGWLGEWGTGAAVGWAICLVAVLPILVSANLHTQLNLQRSTPVAVLAGIGTLLGGCLAQEMVFRGYAFRRLLAAIGENWAALLLSLCFGLALEQMSQVRFNWLALLNGTLFGLLLAMAYLRTNALWTGWGLHFAYRAVAALVLGLPIAGQGPFGSLADTFTTGPHWLAGGAVGLDGGALTTLVMLAGLSVLYTATRDYAWSYTQPLILPAGYEVTVAPPAAHVAMEKAAAPAAPQLVQILPATPQSRSAVGGPPSNARLGQEP